jgi:hypothetical protein
MLTESAYRMALAVYLVSAILALGLLNLWILRAAHLGTRLWVSLPLATLLLTPAYIAVDAPTVAPALVVAVFQGFSQGAGAAEHATRPLLLFTAVAFGVGCVAFLLVSWLRRRAAAPDPDLDLST